MKSRVGFVSNSSSCSFVLVPRNEVEKKFINTIFENIQNELGEMDYQWARGWSIMPHEDGYLFDTTVDNFDMLEYVRKYGFVIKDIEH